MERSTASDTKKRLRSGSSSCSDTSLLESPKMSGNKDKQKEKKARFAEAVNLSDIEELITKKINEFNADMSGKMVSMKEFKILQRITIQIEKIESRVYDAECEVDKMKKEVAEARKERDKIRDMVKQMSKHVTDLAVKFNDLEQQSRKSNIRVWGIVDTDKNETTSECAKKVVDVIRDKLKLDVDINDIDVAHRLGPFKPSGGLDNPKPRPIIVRFMRRTVKQAVVSNRRLLKNTKITIREDLTRINQNLLVTAAEDGRAEYSYSREGKIYVKIDNKRFPKRIKSLADIDSLNRQTDFSIKDFTKGYDEHHTEWGPSPEHTEMDCVGSDAMGESENTQC